VVGAAEDAMAASEQALQQGVFAQAIRPPTVPEGTSRLRLAVMASHTKSELRSAAKVLSAAVPPSVRRDAATGRKPAEPRAAAQGRVFDQLADAA
jgi:glycine C-acetyltransferase/8-amino-7-oxononanoate synthase